MNPLQTVDKPGVYDLDEVSYHADPCPEPSLSSSIGKITIGQTPLHAWTAHPRLNPEPEKEESERFDIGSAAHSLVLHDPQKFEVIDASDWRTKAAKEQREAARAAKKIPLLNEQWVRVHAMAHAARIQLDQHEEARDAFTNGVPEQTLIWKEGNIWCRARLDWLPNAGSIYDDYKSTAATADPESFSRIMFNLGYDFQAAFYTRGIRKLGLCKDPTFRFIVQEVTAPHALAAISLMPSAIELAQYKVQRAIDIWKTCLESGEWPGYAPKTYYVEAPMWHEQQFMAKDARLQEENREKPSPELLRQAERAQAPL